MSGSVVSLFKRKKEVSVSVSDHASELKKRRAQRPQEECYYSSTNGVRAAIASSGSSDSDLSSSSSKSQKKKKKKEEEEEDVAMDVEEDADDASDMLDDDDDDREDEWSGGGDDDDDDDEESDPALNLDFAAVKEQEEQVEREARSLDSDDEDESIDEEEELLKRDKRAAALDRSFFVRHADDGDAPDGDEEVEGLTESEAMIMKASQEQIMRGMSKKKKKQYQQQANGRQQRAREREEKRRKAQEAAEAAKSLRDTVDVDRVLTRGKEEVSGARRALRVACAKWSSDKEHAECAEYALDTVNGRLCTEEMLAGMHCACGVALQTTLSLAAQGNSTKEMPVSPYAVLLREANASISANMFYNIMNEVTEDFQLNVHDAPSVKSFLRYLQSALYLEISRTYACTKPLYCALTGTAVPTGQIVHNVTMVLRDPKNLPRNRIKYVFQIYAARGFADAVSMLWMLYRLPFFIQLAVNEWIEQSNYTAVPPPSITNAVANFLYNEEGIRFVGQRFSTLCLLYFRAVYYTAYVCPQQ